MNITTENFKTVITVIIVVFLWPLEILNTPYPYIRSQWSETANTSSVVYYWHTHIHVTSWLAKSITSQCPDTGVSIDYTLDYAPISKAGINTKGYVDAMSEICPDTYMYIYPETFWMLSTGSSGPAYHG